MSRGYMCSVASDYICRYCGDVCVSFDKGAGLEKKYTMKQIYCPICMTETDHIRLGDKDLVRAKLESMNILEGMDYEIYNLLTTDDSRKEKRLIK